MEVADQSYQLIVRKGPRPGRVFALSLSTVSIGRDPLSDIVIDDPEVSRHHARLERGDEGYSLQDMGSTNGSFVDGKRLGGEPVDLKPGQVVMFGSNVTLIYQATSASDPLATMVAPAVLPEVEAAVPEVEEELVEPVLPDLEPLPEEPLEPELPPIEEILPEEPIVLEEPTVAEFATQEEPLPDLTFEDPPVSELPDEPEIVIVEIDEPFEAPLSEADDEELATMLEMPKVTDEIAPPVDEVPTPLPTFDDTSTAAETELYSGPEEIETPISSWDEPEEPPSMEAAAPPPFEEPIPDPIADSGEPLAEFEPQLVTPLPPPPSPPVDKDTGDSNRNRNIIIAMVIILLLCCCLVTIASGGVYYLGLLPN